jgi:hypothetical protein
LRRSVDLPEVECLWLGNAHLKELGNG